jgi:hypothetical protein
MKVLFVTSGVLFCFILVVLVPPVISQTVEGITILIDGSTTLPVGSGITASSTDDRFLIITEGLVKVPALAFWIYTGGWLDPSGLVRLRRVGQYFSDMPYGSIIGTFSDLPSGFYVGDGGAFSVAPADVGNEFKLGLNMNSSDQSSIEGLFVIHIIKIPGAVVQSTTLAINSATSLPLGTGLTPDDTNDRFILFARGTVRVPALDTWVYTRGWINPSGLIRLRRVGQEFADMPYASVIGTFGNLSQGFYVGKGGTFKVASPDLGNEFKLGLNMNSSDQSSMSGLYVVHAIKIPAAVTRISDFFGLAVPTESKIEQNYPNPFNLTTKINYSVSEYGKVTLRIYDQTGKWIRTLVDKSIPAGDYQVDWDGRDDSGVMVASGLYYYQFSTKIHSETRKLVLLK